MFNSTRILSSNDPTDEQSRDTAWSQEAMGEKLNGTTDQGLRV